MDNSKIAHVTAARKLCMGYNSTTQERASESFVYSYIAVSYHVQFTTLTDTLFSAITNDAKRPTSPSIEKLEGSFILYVKTSISRRRPPANASQKSIISRAIRPRSQKVATISQRREP